MLLFQVSLEKEDEGLAGLLPGGERVSAVLEGAPTCPPQEAPGSPACTRGADDLTGGDRRETAPEVPHNSDSLGFVPTASPRPLHEARSLFPWLTENLCLETTCPFRHVFLPTQCLKCFLIYC